MNVPTIDIQKTGANIKTLRKAAGIKVKDVADTLGVSTQAVAKWQAGTALLPKANEVKKPLARMCEPPKIIIA